MGSFGVGFPQLRRNHRGYANYRDWEANSLEKPAGICNRRWGLLEGPRSETSDAHGHDDVAVAVVFVSEGTHLAGGLFVLELDTDGAVGSGGKKIEHVAGVETDGDRIAVIFLLDRFLRFAIFGARSRNFHAFVRDRKLHGMRALISELGDAANGVAELGALESDRLRIVTRQNGLVIRELASENPRNQEAMADLEKEMAFVLRKFHVRIGAGCSRELLDLVHSFLGDENTNFAIEAGKFLVRFREGEAVAIGRNHGERVRLEDQQAAI